MASPRVARAFAAVAPPHADGEIRFGQLRIPRQPPVPSEIVELLRRLIADGVMERTRANDNPPFGPQLSSSMRRDNERGIPLPSADSVGHEILDNYPRFVLRERDLPVLGYMAHVRDEAYFANENGRWVAYVREHWLRPSPHIDMWHRIPIVEP